jgi:DNA-binding transcriptional MerR regulator
MKTKQIAALLRDDITTIAVHFLRRREIDEDDGGGSVRARITPHRIIKPGPGNTLAYTFKALKEDAKQLVPDDIVVVDTRHGLSLAVVAAVHDEPQIDPDSDYDYRWYVGKVETARHQQILAHEQALEKKVLEAERAIKRKSMVEQFREALGGNLPQANFQALAAPAAPTAPARAFDDVEDPKQ